MSAAVRFVSVANRSLFHWIEPYAKVRSASVPGRDCFDASLPGLAVGERDIHIEHVFPVACGAAVPVKRQPAELPLMAPALVIETVVVAMKGPLLGTTGSETVRGYSRVQTMAATDDEWRKTVTQGVHDLAEKMKEKLLPSK